MKRFLCAVLLLLFSLLCLSACASSQPPAKTGTENPAPSADAPQNADPQSADTQLPEGTLLISQDAKTEYTVLYADQPTDWEKSAALAFRKQLLKVTDAEAAMTTDFENKTSGFSDRQEKEIIIGTCRDEGVVYSVDHDRMTDLGYLIMTVGEKVVITANNALSMEKAISAFFNDCLQEKGDSYIVEPCENYVTLDSYIADGTDIGIWYSVWYTKEEESSAEMQKNVWTAWELGTTSLLSDGTYGTYDTLDDTELLFHFKEMTDAGIDFIIMDQTNYIDTENGVINRRALHTAEKIKEWNDAGNKPLRYCSAVGGYQWSQDPATVEQEARTLWERYVNTPMGSEEYHYYLNGKPVLVAYGVDEADWNAYRGSKTYADKFTIRFGIGSVGDKKEQWGWAATNGTIYSGREESALVMPGWRNRAGYDPVLRENGDFYRKCWETVLGSDGRPRVIIINSFNEFAERTAVFPADATAEPDPDDRYSGTLYWDMTKEYIAKFREKWK